MSRKIICRVVLLLAASVVCMPGAVRAQDYDAYYISGYDHKPSARMEMGVSLAVAYMGISGSEDLSLAPRLGVRGALVMSLCWSERYALQVELAYLFNKIRAERAAEGSAAGQRPRRAFECDGDTVALLVARLGTAAVECRAGAVAGRDGAL